MFSNLKLIGIFGVIFLVLGLAFSVYYKYNEAKIEDLIQKNATLELSLKFSQEAVESLEKRITVLSNANISLTKDLAEAEKNNSDDNKNVDEELNNLVGVEDPKEIERRINDLYEKFNTSIRDVTRSQ